MAKNNKTFTSFADAAAALKGVVASQPPKPVSSKTADFRPPAIRHDDFSAVEAELIAKANLSLAPKTVVPTRRVYEVQKMGRNHNKLVEAAVTSPEQVNADVAAYRSAEALKGTQRAAKEQRAALQAKATLNASPAKPVAVLIRASQPTGTSPNVLGKLSRAMPTRARVPPPAVPAVAVAPPSTPSLPKKQDILKRIREVFAEAPPAIEQRPRAVQAVTRNPVESAIARGAQLFARRAEPDMSGYIIGCDFGTSSMKIIVRQPYSAGDPAARPAPTALRSMKHPYLWQTVVWFEPLAGTFSLLPSKGAVALEGFKAGILAGEGGKRVIDTLPVTRSEAAAAFLALQLSHCLGWYDMTRPLGEQGSDHFLAINIGIPVAAQDDCRTYNDFRHVVSAARNLIGEAAHLTHERVRSARQASSHDLPEGFDLVPELAAAISGYANEPFARLGSHMMIDVGASTLDIVAFILFERDGQKVVSAMAAEVELLGAAALDAARQTGSTDTEFRGACVGQFDAVYNYAKRQDVAPRNFDRTLRSKPVQLIVVGGGCKTAVHKDLIMRVHPCLGEDLKILSPQPPLHLSAGDCDASRLLLAYGLTADIPEQLELRRPSEIPRIVPPRRTSISFVSKDQV